MNVLVVLAGFGILTLCHCLADIPSYCGAEMKEYEAVKDGTLRQVHMITRHGDRIQANAGECWKGDTYTWDCLLTEAVTPTINRAQQYLRVERLYRKVYYTGREEIPGNCALGQLTSIGFHQHLRLGEKIRSIYVKSGFLSPNFSSVEHRVRSTDIYNTFQSAEMFMTGMFPPFQPVEGRPGIMDINTMDGTYENMYPNPKLCPKSQEYLTAFFGSASFVRHYETVSLPLVKELQIALRDPSFNYQDIFKLFDCLNVYKCHKIDTPSAITPELYQRIVDEATYVFYNMYSYPTKQEASKVGIGFFIKELHKEIAMLMSGESKFRFILYSGHDVTLMTLLLAFNISDGVWPPYASQFVIEIYEMDNKEFYLRILYNGKAMKLPFCNDQELCDIVNVVKPYIANFEPESVEKNCKSSEKKI